MPRIVAKHLHKCKDAEKFSSGLLGSLCDQGAGSLYLSFIMNGQESALVLRGRIVELSELNFSNRAIADRLGISIPTVMKWRKRWEESGNVKNLRK